jgi:hypothetical protein
MQQGRWLSTQRRKSPQSPSSKTTVDTQELSVIRILKILGMVVHTYNPSTWEDEASGLRVQGQPRLHSKILIQKNKNRNDHLIIHQELRVQSALPI